MAGLIGLVNVAPIASRELLDKRRLEDMMDRPDSKRGRYSFLD